MLDLRSYANVGCYLIFSIIYEIRATMFSTKIPIPRMTERGFTKCCFAHLVHCGACCRESARVQSFNVRDVSICVWSCFRLFISCMCFCCWEIGGNPQAPTTSMTMLFLRSLVLDRLRIPNEYCRLISAVEYVAAHLRKIERDSRSEVVFCIDEWSIDFGFTGSSWKKLCC